MRGRIRLLGVAAVMAVVTSTAAASGGPRLATDHIPEPNDPCDSNIYIPYVATGDAVPVGNKAMDTDGEVDDEERYTEKLTEMLVDGHQPYCLFNVSNGSTSTTDYVEEDVDGASQLSKAFSLHPGLITVQVGRENGPAVVGIKGHISDCLDMIKDHRFIEANACALAILANQNNWDRLGEDMSYILNQYDVLMAGHPNLVVATLGYFNPYPSATSVATEIPGFCAKLVDTIPTCIIRWVLLPPVLVTLDQIVKKMNTTIEGVVKRFSIGSQGRFYFVNPYDAFEDHCMKMKVTIKTKVYHPTNQVDQHDTDNDFGCSDPWIESDGTDGKLPPWHYLPPAVTGVLIFTEQTTEGMGAYPDKDGHECLAKLIYEADNGWGPLKHKLGIAEERVEDPCS